MFAVSVGWGHHGKAEHGLILTYYTNKHCSRPVIKFHPSTNPDMQKKNNDTFIVSWASTQISNCYP